MENMNVRKISEGLIHVLQKEGDLCLYEIITRHEEFGLRVPGVNCTCNSQPGDDDDHLFLLAFLEVLRHHVRLEQIEGWPDDDEEKEIWDKWVAGRRRARKLRRSCDGYVPSSRHNIIPERLGVVGSITLFLSDKTWNAIIAGAAAKIVHLDHVESPLFKVAQEC